MCTLGCDYHHDHEMSPGQHDPSEVSILFCDSRTFLRYQNHLFKFIPVCYESVEDGRGKN